MIIILHTEPHIAMIFGIALVSVTAMAYGFSWQDIEDGIIEGMTKSLGACTILLMIGLLIGVWISGGVVPAMIYYGLHLLGPRTFLVGSLLLCAAVSMALGSWGTAGTIGIALIGVAQILGIPLPLAAGTIVSGCYLGDRISPISDMSNLTSAVSGVDIVSTVKAATPLNLACLAVSCIIYWRMGLQYAGDSDSLRIQVERLCQLLQGQFDISPLCLLPLILLLGCILAQIPAIPSIFIGIFSAGVMAVLLQRQDLTSLMACCFSGFISDTGNETVDALLSAGGIESMHYSLSLALTAMMLGGVMDKTGVIAAFMGPFLGKLRRKGDLSAAVVISTLAVNVILPDSYVAIVIPGRMFSDAYEQNKLRPQDLSLPLGSGACSFSPLIPWNACGVFISTVLGASVVQYAPYALLNILVPVGAVILGYASGRRKIRGSPADRS